MAGHSKPGSLTPPPDEGRAERVSEAWRLLVSVVYDLKDRFVAVARELGLNPGSAHALSTLDPARPEPMSALAATLKCDASMATWHVDRLEERGYVERQPSPTDRRVKMVVLTPAGVAARERMRAQLDEPPGALSSLADDEIEGLSRALEKLLAATTGERS